MAKKSNKKKGPKVKEQPSAGTPKIGNEPESYDRHKISWQFGKLDISHERWGWHNFSHQHFWDTFTQRDLKHIESMTWAELRSATGGRARGTNHHAISVDDLCREAQEQLEVLNLDDQDQVFSIRLTGTTRVVGIRAGSAFQVLWYDENHEICPAGMRHS